MRTKKIVASVVLAGLVFVSAPSMATATTAQDDLLAQLQAQIQTLLAQVTQLQEQIAAQQGEIADVKAQLLLERSLYVGASGDDVEDLQEYLAQYPDLYPEGLVTGYFGSLTERAVKKFQKKYDIEQVGIVGPQTRQRIRDLTGVAVGKKDDAVPPGLAVGWTKDDDDDDKKYPGKKNYYIDNKIVLCHNGNTITVAFSSLRAHLAHGDAMGECDGDVVDPADDTTPPEISGLSVDPAATSAVITWTTDEDATGSVKYATTSDLSGFVLEVSNNALTQDHSFTLINLDPETDYYYEVSSEDSDGNASDEDGDFTTDAETVADTTAPDISDVVVSTITHESATVSWTTDEDATGKIVYSTNSDLTTGALEMSSGTLTQSHTFDLGGLAASTTYYFKVVSEDAASNSAEETGEFTTEEEPADTTAPAISALGASTGTTTMTISWTTDEDATGMVKVGTSTDVVATLVAEADESTLSTAHSFVIEDLDPDTMYYYTVESKDEADNTSTDTGAAQTDALPTV